MDKAKQEIVIRDYNENDLDFIIKRHKELYAMEYNFTDEFEDYVKEYLLKFHEKHDKTNENIWIAEMDGTQVGVIALVKVDENTAQLRWFLIEPIARGKGLGNKLMKTLLTFAKEKNYNHIYLWTLSMLNTARNLYTKYGFELTETKESKVWGKTLLEERWDLFYCL